MGSRVLEQAVAKTSPAWPEWCRRLFALKAGMLVRADGGRWLGELGKAPPQGMIE